MISKLLAAADNDVEKAERGIVFIDEIDKIAKKKDTHHRDVSGEIRAAGAFKASGGSRGGGACGSQQQERYGSADDSEYPEHSVYLRRRFPDLENLIKERLNQKSSMGFQADLKDKYDNDPNLLSRVTVEDLRSFA